MGASPLLLVVHGRAGGVTPAAWQALAMDLVERRGAPVGIQCLTAPAPPGVAWLGGDEPAGQVPLLLAPMFLFPGGHVRTDVPAIVSFWRRTGPVRRLPFLGAWDGWLNALAEESDALLRNTGLRPVLVHHPLEGPLASRYLALLEQVCAADCHATPYSAADLEELSLAIRGPALPMALAANRLTDRLAALLGPPLLERSRFRRVLIDRLVHS